MSSTVGSSSLRAGARGLTSSRVMMISTLKGLSGMNLYLKRPYQGRSEENRARIIQSYRAIQKQLEEFRLIAPILD